MDSRDIEIIVKNPSYYEWCLKHRPDLIPPDLDKEPATASERLKRVMAHRKPVDYSFE